MKFVEIDDLIAGISSDLIADLALYWERLRGGRILPLRAELDPIGIGRALSQIWLVDCTNLDRITHQLVGEGIKIGYDESPVGRTVDEVHDAETASYLRSMAVLIAKKKCVLHGISRTADKARLRWDVERIALPFASEPDTEVSHILGGSVVIEQSPNSFIHRKQLKGQFDPTATVAYQPKL